MIRKIAGVVLLLILVIGLWQYQLLVYGLSQARGQIRILANVRSVASVLQDASVPDSTKEKLIFIQEVRQYAVDSLGINDSKNYTTFYDQGGKPSLWVVTAAAPFALEAREWKFPLLGSFPYKGFFEYDMALEESEKLKESNLDTHIGIVNGWSTLGWFKDPILSNMLLRNEGNIASLIIHELTHGTLFVKDSVEFNENLATFIGDEGARRFLKSKFGEKSLEYETYLQDKIDHERYVAHILRGCSALDSLYATFETNDEATTAKLEKKHALIDEIMDNIDTVSFNRPTRYAHLKNNTRPNNAFFMSYIRYQSKQTSFDDELKQRFNNDLRLYLEYLKERYPSL